jgi:hypothetical protein
VIIVSLVRSNEQGDIGFLAAPERVNVMLTRARLGMYVLGNLHCLTHCRSARGRQLWGELSTVLHRGGHVRDHLPLWCETHKLVREVRMPEDFKELSPLGGCSLLCGEELQCGHNCPLPCHSRSEGVHATHKCQELVSDVCKFASHPGERKCSDAQLICSKIVYWKCHRGHSLTGQCSDGRPTAHCFICAQLEARELELEKQEQARFKAEMKLEERKAAMQQTVGELQANKAHVERTQLLDQELALLNQAVADAAAEAAAEAAPQAGKADAASAGKGGALSEKKAKKLAKTLERKEAKVRTKQGHAGASAEVPSDDEVLAATGASQVLADEAVAAEPAVESATSEGGSSKKKTVLSGKGHAAGGGGAKPAIDQGAMLSDIEYVFGVYASDGALKAHDAVGAAVSAWAAEHSGPLPPAFDALGAILVREVDPKSDLSSIASLAAGKLLHGPMGTLLDAVCCMGALLVCENENLPMQAKHHATRLVAYCAASGSSHKVPQAWLDTATSIAARTSVLEAARAKAPATPQRHDAAAKWAKVLEEDPKAPAVMAEEILPMIGLEDVKENMISQYYRIKLAQRQGDGAAASYNLRFDGNPGETIVPLPQCNVSLVGTEPFTARGDVRVVLTCTAGCSETRHGRVLGPHQLSQSSSAHSLTAGRHVCRHWQDDDRSPRWQVPSAAGSAASGGDIQGDLRIGVDSQRRGGDGVAAGRCEEERRWSHFRR